MKLWEVLVGIFFYFVCLWGFRVGLIAMVGRVLSEQANRLLGGKRAQEQPDDKRKKPEGDAEAAAVSANK